MNKSLESYLLTAKMPVNAGMILRFLFRKNPETSGNAPAGTFTPRGPSKQVDSPSNYCRKSRSNKSLELCVGDRQGSEIILNKFKLFDSEMKVEKCISRL